MARTTRSKGSSTAATATSQPSVQSRYALPPSSDNPPKVFVLPRKATKEARIVSLLNPRYGKPTRYLVCPETGFYEFTRIAAPTSTPRSWLISCRKTKREDGDVAEGEQESAATAVGDTDAARAGSSHVAKDADLYVATPVDPLFLVLPAFASALPKSGSDRERLLLSSDDRLDTIQQTSPHLWEVLRWGKIRTLLETRMAAVCDTADVGDGTMFRFNEDKVLAQMLLKAENMIEAGGLPRSMEDKFVSKVLEAPVVGIKSEVSTSTTVTSSVVVSDGLVTQQTAESSETITSTPNLDSQSSLDSTTTTDTADSTSSFAASEASTAATSMVAEEETTMVAAAAATESLAPTMQASDDIVRLQRLRTAFHYICSSYIPPPLAAELKRRLQAPKSPKPKSESRQGFRVEINFAPLDEYLSQIAQLRHEAAARSMADYSRKRPLDDEEVAERAEKKRKREEEEKRKKVGESKGIRDLKKVSTTGMKKMSDFFKKKT